MTTEAKAGPTTADGVPFVLGMTLWWVEGIDDDVYHITGGTPKLVRFPTSPEANTVVLFEFPKAPTIYAVGDAEGPMEGSAIAEMYSSPEAAVMAATAWLEAEKADIDRRIAEVKALLD